MKVRRIVRSPARSGAALSTRYCADRRTSIGRRPELGGTYLSNGPDKELQYATWFQLHAIGSGNQAEKLYLRFAPRSPQLTLSVSFPQSTECPMPDSLRRHLQNPRNWQYALLAYW